MATKTRVVIYLDPATVAALQALQRTSGASLSELCRRSIVAWLTSIQRPIPPSVKFEGHPPKK
jgi:hypothetical protein